VYPQISQAIYKNVNEALSGRGFTRGAMKRRRPEMEQAWPPSRAMTSAPQPSGRNHAAALPGSPGAPLAWFMVSPSLVLIALVAAYPIIYGVWLSLHEYSVRVAGLSAGPD
jgi:hypothetical protein